MRTVMPVSAFGYKFFKRLNDSPFILLLPPPGGYVIILVCMCVCVYVCMCVCVCL